MADGLQLRAPCPRTKLVALAVASCFAGALHANPVGPTVMYGTATFNAVGNALNIANSPNAIINWQGFSIGGSEITRFIQNSAASSVLNRVTGAESSGILGQLLSNGRVLLINPNGVFIGGGAVVDVAGFTASSLKISDADFLAGKFKFTDQVGAARIVNQGIIRTPEGGQVYLIAPNVENSGLITSPTGEVVLAAGKTVELIQQGTPYLRVELTAPDNAAVNVGQVIARGGNIGIYGSTIRNSGVVSATTATVGENGKIVLKAKQDVTLDADGRVEASGPNGGTVTAQAEGGTLLASGAVEAKGAQGKGGEINLLGDRVGLVGKTLVDASGETGGGQVLVGGDFQGKNPEVQNAQRTVVSKGVSLRANAVSEGDGGKVVVWSDDVTRFRGTISARGGKEKGDGGFVEVSGKKALEFRGRVDVEAPAGVSGTLLLDPADITVVASGGTLDNQLDAGTADANLLHGDGGANTTLSVGELTAFTSGTVTLQATNDIDIQVPVALSSDVSLVAQAGNDVKLTNTGTLAATGSGTLTLAADANLSGTGGPASNGVGQITRTAATNTISQANGTLTLSAASGILANTNVPTISVSNTTTGNINVTNSSALSVSGTNSAPGGSINIETTGGSSTLTVGGAISTANRTAVADPATSGGVTLTSSAGVVLNSTVTTGSASVTDTSGVDRATSGSITVTAGTGVTGTGSLTTGTASADSTLGGNDTATSGSIVLNGTSVGLGNATAALTTGTATITAGNAGDVASAGSMTLGDSSTMAVINNGTSATPMKVRIGAPTSAGTATAGQLVATTSGATGDAGGIFASSDQALKLGAIAAGGNVDISSTALAPSGPVLTVSGTMASGGTITLSADDMAINGTVNANSGAAGVTLQQANAARNIDVGTDTAGTLGLMQSELNELTASVVRIGDPGNAGNITVSAPVSAPSAAPGTWNTLHLRTAGAILGNSGGTDLTVTNLALTAGAGITNTTTTNPLSTAVSELAFSNTTSGAVRVTNSATTAIDDVDTLTSGSSGAGLIDVTVTGAGNTLTLTRPLSTIAQTASGSASGSITLTANSGATDIIVNNTVTTGSSTVVGSGGADTAASGAIAVNGTLSGTGSLVTGGATVTGGAVGDIATVGGITIAGATKVSRTAGAANTDKFTVSFGTANSGATNAAGQLAVTTTGGADAAGGIFVTSAAPLTLGGISTAGGSAQTIDIDTSSGALTVAGTSSTNDNWTLSGASALTITGTLGVGTLTGTAAGGDLAANSGVTSTGNLTLNSTGAMSLGASGALDSGTGLLALNVNTSGADASSFTMTSGSTLTSANTTANAIKVLVNNDAGATGTASLRGIAATGEGGAITVNTNTGGATGGAITVNSAISTGAVATSGVTSGAITLTSGSGVAVNNTVTTGSSTVVGSGGADTAASGAIAVNGTLSGTGSLVTGGATVTGGAVGDIATVGGITIAGATKVSRTAGAANTDKFTVSFGTANSGATNAAGQLAVTTTGGADAAGGIFVTSAAPLTLGNISAGGNVDITNSNTVTVAGVVSTADVPTAAAPSTSGSISLQTTSGDVVINDTASVQTGQVAPTTGSNPATSGSVTIQAAGNVTATGSGQVATGNAAAPGATAQVGDIVINAAQIGTGSGPTPAVAVALGTPAGGTSTAGAINLTTTGTGPSGNAYITSAAPLNVKDITVPAAQGSTVSIASTLGNPITFAPLATYTGLAGSAANGANILVTTTGGTGGTVTFGKDLEAGSITVTSAGAVTVNANLKTSDVSTSSAAATTGNIQIAAAGDVTGTGSLTTGNAANSGTIGGATSGKIVIDATGGTGGKIALGGTLTTGTATLSNGLSTATAAAGDVELSGKRIGDSSGTPQVVALGTASGGVAPTGGAIKLLATGTSAGSDGAWVTSSQAITTDTVSATGTGAPITIASTGGAVTLGNTVTSTGGAITISGAGVASALTAPIAGLIVSTAGLNTGTASGAISIFATGAGNGVALAGDIDARGASNALGNGSDAGVVLVTAADGPIQLGNVYASGGEGTAGDGGAGKNIDITVTGAASAGRDITVNGSVDSSGGAGDGATNTGGSAGTVTVAVQGAGAGSVSLNVVMANGGAGTNGASAGSAGGINATSLGTDITVDGALTATKGATGPGGSDGTITLTAGGAVLQTATGVISAGALQVNAVNSSSLDTATNNVTTVAANVTGAGQGFSYTNAGALAIGAVTNGTTNTSGITANGGAVTLMATGGTLNVNETVSSTGAGTLTLTATGGSSDVVVATGKSVTSTGGNIALNADRDITLTGTGTVITSGTGTITLTADADNTTSGAINANNSTTAIQAGSGLVTLLARTGIAAGTTIDNVTATNSAGGTSNIVIADTAGGLTVSTGGVNQSGSGTVGITATGGTLNVNETVSSTGAGTLTLTATGGSSDVVVATGKSVTSTGGNIALNADRDITLTGTGTVITSGTGTITLTADADNTTSGAINANNSTTAIQAGSGLVTLLARTGIAAGTTIDNVTATNSAGGTSNIVIADTAGGLTVSTGGVNQSGSGTVGITATGGTLNVNETVSSTGAGTLTLTATGGSSDVVVATGKSVTSTGGNIALNADRDITLTGTGTVITSGTGTITLTADADNTTSGAINANNSTTAIQAGSGLVTLLARTGIAAGTTIDNVTATNSAGGTSNIVIADTAGGLTVSTGGVNQSGSGTVGITATGGTLNVNETVSSTGAGTLTLTATGGSSDVVVATGKSVTSTGGNIALNADRDITLTGTGTVITSGTGTITLTADADNTTSGAINANNSTTAIQAGSGLVTLLARTGIAAGTTIDNVTATNSAGGTSNIVIADTAGGLTVSTGGVNQSGSGTVGITATGGTLNVNETVSSTGAGTLTLTATGGSSDVVVATGKSVTSTGGNIALNADRDITLTGTGTVITSGTGTITLTADADNTTSGAINANNSTTAIQAGSGLVTLLARTGIAAGTTIDNVTATNSAGGTSNIVIADTAGGLTVSTGGVNQSGSGTVGITATGGTLNVNETVSSTGAGTLTLTATGGSSDVVVATGKSVTSTGGNIALNADRDITLTGTGTVITSGTGTITLTADADNTTSGAINANNSTTAIQAGSGLVTLLARTGIAAGTTIDNVTATNSAGGTSNIVIADTAGGLTVSTGGVNQSGSGTVGITATGGTLNVNETVSSTGAGTLTLTATGGSSDVVVATGKSVTSTGGNIALNADRDITLTGTGTVITSGTGTITLTADADNTTSGAINANNSTTAIQAGSGLVTLLARTGIAAGTTIDNVTATNSAGGTSNIVIADTAGGLTVSTGGVNQSGSGTVGITATGGTLNVNETVSSTGAGTLTLTATGGSSDVVVATGKSVTSTGGNIALNADRDITLTGTGTVITSGTGTITLTADADNTTSGAINANNSTTAIQAGSGLVTLLARTGIAAGTTIDNVTATNSAGGAIAITNTQALNVLSVQQTGNGVVALGTASGDLTIAATPGGSGIVSTGNGTVTLNPAGTLVLANDITTAGGAVIVNGPTTLGVDANIDTTSAGAAAGGNITFNGTGSTIDSDATARLLTLTAGTGSIDLQAAAGDVAPLSSLNIISATSARFGADVTTTGAQDVTAGTIRSNATHTTGNADISFTGNLVLEGNTTLTTGAGAGDITVTGTTVAASAGGQSLDLTAGTGAIDLRGAVGGTALSSLKVDSATTARFGGSVTTTGTQDITAGTILTNAVHTTSNAKVDLRGDVSLQGGTTFSSGSGDVTFHKKVDGGRALTINSTGTTTFKDAVGGGASLASLTTDAGGSTVFQNGVVTTAAGQSYRDAVVATVDTTFTGANVQFNNTLDSLNPGAAKVTVNDSGITRFEGAVGSTGALSSLTTDQPGTTFVSSVRIDTTGEQKYEDPVILAGGGISLMNSSGGNVTFENTVSDFAAGGDSLTINAGGDVKFSGAVGATRLGDILITGANSVTALAGVTSRSLTTTGILTMVKFAGPLDTAGPVSLTAAGPINTSAITTSAGGPVTFGNGGLLTVGGNINADGAVTQTTLGQVALNADIRTTSDEVSFAGPVTLGLGPRLIDTSAAGAGADITFDNTLNGGGNDLTLNAGNSGSVYFIGAVSNMGALNLSNVANLALLGGFTGNGLIQASGTGSTTLGGAIITTGPLGISITTNGTIAVSGQIDTNNNPVTFNASDWNFGGSTINAGTQPITISQVFNGTINIGSQVDTADLSALVTGNQLYIGGASNTGIVNIDGSANFAATTPNVTLRATGSGGRITQTNPTAILGSPTTLLTLNADSGIGVLGAPIRLTGTNVSAANAGSGDLVLQFTSGNGTLAEEFKNSAESGVIDVSNLNGSIITTTEVSGEETVALTTASTGAPARIDIGAEGISAKEAVMLQAANDIVIASGQGVRSTGSDVTLATLGSASGTGADPAGSISIDGPVSAAGFAKIATANGSITTTAPVSAGTTLSMTANSNGAAARLDIGAGGITASDGVTLRAADDLTINSGKGVVSTNGEVTMLAGNAAGMSLGDLTPDKPASAPDVRSSSGIDINAPVHAPGIITLLSTGPIKQSVIGDAGLQASTKSGNGTLKVATYNDAGAAITLKSDTTTGIGICAGPVGSGNCFGTVQIEARFADGRVTEYAPGDIDYSGISGISVQKVGTGADARLASPSVTLPTPDIFARNASFYATGGNIDLDAQIANGNINKGVSGGSLNLYAQGNVNVNAPVSPVSAGVSIGRRAGVDPQGTVTADPFQHDLTLTATGDIDVTGSIYLAADRDLNLRADASNAEVAPGPTPGAPSPGDGAGSVKLTTQPASHYGAGGSVFPLEVRARNIVVGTKQGALIFPVQDLEINTTLPGLPADGTSQRADALLSASENLEVYLTGDLRITAGATRAVTTATTQKLQSTAVAAMEGKDVVIRGAGSRDFAVLPANDSSIFLTAGSAMADNGAGGDAFAAADAAIIASRTKTIDIGGDLWLQGGTTTRKRNADLNLINLVSAQAFLDPVTMNIATGGNIVLIAGLGSNASAKIVNSGDMKLLIGGHGPVTFFNPLTEKTQTVPQGGLVLVGGPGSGIFDAFNNPTGLRAPPVEADFFRGGAYTSIVATDNIVAPAYVQSGPTRNFDSLLSYILYAANEETRVTRVRVGTSSKDDASLPSCN